MSSRDWGHKGIEAARLLGPQRHRVSISGFSFQSSQAGPSPHICMLFRFFLPRWAGSDSWNEQSRPLLTILSLACCAASVGGDNDMWGRDSSFPLPEASVLKYTWCLGIDWGQHPLLGVSAFGRLVERVQDHEQVTLYTAPFVLLWMSQPATIQAKSRCNDNKRYPGMEDWCGRQLPAWGRAGKGQHCPWS